MCPGRPPARASTSSAPASTRSHGPSSSAGSRLPWTPRSSPALPAAVERHAPVDADHVAAGRGHRVEQRRRRSGAEVDHRHVDRLRGCARSTARRTRRSPPARARRPTSRRAGSRRAPASTCARGSATNCSASRSISACQTSGSRYISAFVAHEVAARLPLDQVAGDGERAAAEADDGALRLELRAHEADRLEHRRAPLGGIDHAQPLDVGRDARSAGRRPARRPRRTRRRRPSAETGSMMSANRIAASTPCRRPAAASPRRRAPASCELEEACASRGARGTPAGSARPGA